MFLQQRCKKLTLFFNCYEMIIKKIKLNADRLGIITSVACAIHCTILPLLVSSASLFNFEILENKAIEWGMICLALAFGSLSLYHGYAHHHRNAIPVILFSTGFIFLILNQLIAERFVYIFIPLSAAGIISAHVLNIYYCRKSGRCCANKSPLNN